MLEPDKNTKVFLAFKAFYDYRRQSGTTITDFMIRYEYLYTTLGNHNVILPEAVQAFFLLTAANVSEENEKLARATCGDLTYNNMKSTIQKIFGDPGSKSEGSSAAPCIKTEPAFVASTQEEEAYWTRNSRAWSQGSSGRYRGRGFRGRGRGQTDSRFSWKKRGTGSGNPVDRYGNALKCFKCGSKEHFAKDCTSEEVHFTLLSSKLKDDQSDKPLNALLEETLGMAIVDSACSKTVCGKVWMDAYREQLSDQDKALVKVYPTSTKFRFGDGAQCISNNLVKFPAVIGKKKVPIEANVVEADIPLLLSRKSMKVAGCTLDFKHDTIEILDQSIKLISTKSGHYCIPLTKFILNSEINTSIVLHTSAVEEMSVEQKRQKALKLHRQFSHASKEKLSKLVRGSGSFNDKEFLSILAKCCDDCELCQKFKRPPSRPVVGLPLSDDFNQVVCLDLKEHIHNKEWMLHLIDSKTRYSQACIIKSKKQEVVTNAIFLMWIAYFGSPNSFMSDNGGEFSNESYHEMNEKLNVVTATTAAESPFSNGMIERHHLVLYSTMEKTMIEMKCDATVALAWAISSKNCLQNHDGFSPNQLVFGRNPNMPSVLIDKLPALSRPNIDIVRNHLNSMHAAREAFIKAESDDRIRRALRHNVRTYADTKYRNGDKVYYRRKDHKSWQGPAIVLGQDGQMVGIRHGGFYSRIHPSQLMLVKDSNEINKSTVTDGVLNPPTHQIERRKQATDNRTVDDDNDEEPEVTENPEVAVEAPVNTPVEPGHKPVNKPMRNTTVKYKLDDEIGWTKAKVIHRQPKQTGTYKHWVNVHVEEAEQPVCVNWQHVREWKEVTDDLAVDDTVVDDIPVDENEIDELHGNDDDEEEVLLIKYDSKSPKVKEAMDKEIGNLINNDVFDTVPYDNQQTVSSKWILTEKFKDGNKVIKARLVARGFEEDSSNLIKDSPTCSRESLRLVYLTTVLQKWRLQSMDITAAFLQGWPLEREVYLQPPRDVCSSEYCWRLKRCIYGLNDAPRKWYDKVQEVLLQLGGKVSVYDNALFLWHNDANDLVGILACHVDDFSFAGNDWFQSKVIDEFKRRFQVKSHDVGSFKFLGLRVNQSSADNSITIGQEQYVETLEPIKLSQIRSSKDNAELNSDERSELRRLSGQMLWVSSQTRPDLSYETCMMSNVGKHPTIKKVVSANKALRQLKSKDVSLKFSNLGDPKRLVVTSYSDATYASLPDGSSQGGVITFVEGSNGKVAPICWNSKKLTRVTKSPLASETLALNEGADSGFFIASMLQEIFRMNSRPVVKCITDNASLTETLKTSTIVADKRLRVDVARLREMVREDEITVEWIPGQLQIADSLTKRGASTKQLIKVVTECCLH